MSSSKNLQDGNYFVLLFKDGLFPTPHNWINWKGKTALFPKNRDACFKLASQRRDPENNWAEYDFSRQFGGGYGMFYKY